jgi:hypothetical protein
MFLNLRELLGSTVRATGGEIGRVEDFFVNVDEWTLRYLVVESGEWLSGRTLLFSSRAFNLSNSSEPGFSVTANREQIQDSPEIRRDRPLNRQEEIDLHAHYRWPFYWKPGDSEAIGIGSVAAYPLADLAEQMRQSETGAEIEQNPHLRSFKELAGFSIQARDGAIGRMEDCIVDSESWNLLYLVVDTGSLLPGRKVLISPGWVEQVDWEASTLHVDLSRETVRNSPEYDPEQPLDRETETRLYDHYGRKRYG